VRYNIGFRAGRQWWLTMLIVLACCCTAGDRRRSRSVFHGRSHIQAKTATRIGWRAYRAGYSPVGIINAVGARFSIA